MFAESDLFPLSALPHWLSCPRQCDLIHLVGARAAVLCGLGFKQMDALHLASAEELRADYCLSTDDRLVTRAATHSNLLKVVVANPLNFPNL